MLRRHRESAGQAAKDADLLILVVAREDMANVVEQLKGKVKTTATAVETWPGVVR